MKKIKKIIFSLCLIFILIGVVKAAPTISGPRKVNDLMTWDLITFGRYKDYWYYEDYVDPIVWRVLAIEGDSALVVAEKLLPNSVPYHSVETKILWSNSDLRAW